MTIDRSSISRNSFKFTERDGSGHHQGFEMEKDAGQGLRHAWVAGAVEDWRSNEDNTKHGKDRYIVTVNSKQKQ